MSVLMSVVFLIGCADNLESSVAQDSLDRETVRFRVDFGEEDGHSDWSAVNDTVMGGESIGVVNYTDTQAVFSGTVSTDNNGGFVSLRSPVGTYDLSEFTEVEISYRGEGHSFKMVLADEVAWWLPTFESEIAPPTEGWTTEVISLSEFEQYEMTGYGDRKTGVTLSEEHLSNIVRIDLMNKEFVDGDFELEVDYIEFRGYVE